MVVVVVVVIITGLGTGSRRYLTPKLMHGWVSGSSNSSSSTVIRVSSGVHVMVTDGYHRMVMHGMMGRRRRHRFYAGWW